MYFDTKNYLKNTSNHTAKHASSTAKHASSGPTIYSVLVVLSNI
jgi:hypothetical protein